MDMAFCSVIIMLAVQMTQTIIDNIFICPNLKQSCHGCLNRFVMNILLISLCKPCFIKNAGYGVFCLCYIYLIIGYIRILQPARRISSRREFLCFIYIFIYTGKQFIVICLCYLTNCMITTLYDSCYVTPLCIYYVFDE